VVLDAGALIALERNDRTLWAALKLGASGRADVLVPSTALAQAWRGRPAQARLSQALQYCVVVPFDPVARQVGELCSRARTSDICDAHVALVASTHGDVVYTSDPGDLRRLLLTCRRAVAVVRC
jgi:predicted nucleic acid-binding protein